MRPSYLTTCAGNLWGASLLVKSRRLKSILQGSTMILCRNSNSGLPIKKIKGAISERNSLTCCIDTSLTCRNIHNEHVRYGARTTRTRCV